MRQYIESENVKSIRIPERLSITIQKKDQTFTGPSADALSSLDATFQGWKVRRLGPLHYLFWR